MYSLPLRQKVDKFSLPLFSLHRGARYSLFDKSTSISSLREHQLQDSSWDINLLSRRNVISRAIDTLVANTNNTKTIAGSSLIKKKEGKRVRVQAAFGSNTKVRMMSREACNLLSKDARRSRSQPYFLSTTDCWIIFSMQKYIETDINNSSNYKVTEKRQMLL